MDEAALEHTFLSTNGVTLHVVRAGPEDGPLVVLLHGFPEHWYAWRRYLGRLARAGFRVIAPDQRGYNLSDKPLRVRDYHLDVLAADVVGLIDAEGRKKACVVGHDWGAGVAWWTAMRHPERVERMTAINVPHPEVLRTALLGGGLRQLRKSWYMFYFQLPWLPERVFGRDRSSDTFRKMASIGRANAFSPDEEAAYREAWAQPGAARGMIDWYRAAVRSGFGERPEDLRIHVPAQIIWGRQDVLLGEDLVQPSLDLCDDGRVVWFDEATHWVLHEEHEAVADALVSFLGEGR